MIFHVQRNNVIVNFLQIKKKIKYCIHLNTDMPFFFHLNVQQLVIVSQIDKSVTF